MTVKKNNVICILLYFAIKKHHSLHTQMCFAQNLKYDGKNVIFIQYILPTVMLCVRSIQLHVNKSFYNTQLYYTVQDNLRIIAKFVYELHYIMHF